MRIMRKAKCEKRNLGPSLVCTQQDGTGFCGATDKNPLIELIQSSNRNTPDAIRVLLENSPSLLLELDATNGNTTALHFAVSASNLEITRLLLCLGADPNVANAHGQTPRHWAAKLNEWGGWLCVRLCQREEVEKAEEALPSSGTGNTTSAPKPASYTSVKVEDFENRAFAKDQFRFDKLLDIQHNDIYDEVLEKLPEVTSDEGSPPDHNFINVLSLDGGGIRGLVIIQLLIYVERIMGEPIFPYFDWAGGTFTGMVMGLLSYGAGLDEQTTDGDKMTALHLAVSNRNLQITRLLLCLGADPNVANAHGQTPRHWAAKLNEWGGWLCVRLCQREEVEKAEEALPSSGTGNTTSAPKPASYTSVKVEDFENRAFAKDQFRFDKLLDIQHNVRFKKLPFLGHYCEQPVIGTAPGIQSWNSFNKYKNFPNAVNVGCFLSIGTGVIPPTPLEPTYLEVAQNWFAQPFTSINAFRTIGEILVDQATATEWVPVLLSGAFCIQQRAPFFRLNAPLFRKIKMDEKNDADIARMMWDCMKIDMAFCVGAPICSLPPTTSTRTMWNGCAPCCDGLAMRSTGVACSNRAAFV
ncbi:hypothetical protein niasHT_022976 [Heterodera trifolii]|uniref:Uncharacterized protein n=1 Tax=Heterodera trifolii TaxID=157864 RepID=A0ABD2KP53_9BILA